MTKIPVTDPLVNHLDQETTTLATCWKITRLDGTVHGLTKHDEDITVSSQLYRSVAGFSISAISNSDTYEAGNTDITGFFDDRGVPETATKSGLLDNADVEVFMVNYENIGSPLILLAGKIREIEYTATGKYTIELSGYKHLLNQTIGDLVQPECRADLGDRKCKFPLDPVQDDGNRREREGNTAYKVGDFILVATGNNCSEVDAGFRNLDFEQTFEESNAWARSSNFSQMVTGNAQQGSRYLQVSGGDTVTQSITIDNSFHSEIDAGTMQLRISVWRSRTINSNGNSRTATIRIKSNGITVLTMQPVVDGNTWFNRVQTIILPALSRTLTIEIEAIDATYCDVDSINVQFLTGDRSCYNVYGDRIYECTTAGTTAATRPTYNTGIGATTTDGGDDGAVFTARQSWTRHTLVTGVSSTDSRRIVTVGLSLKRGRKNGGTSDIDDISDDWYNQGVCFFESGNNAGLRMEIKDWDASAKQVTLWDAMPNTIAVSDSVVLSTGCNKQISTCKNKFQIPGSTDFASGNNLNYRGEPYLPGRDRILVYPDR